MKVAVVGVGYWGENHLRVYSRLRRQGIIDDVIISDTNAVRVKSLSRNFDVQYKKSLSEILKDEEIKSVSLVTPSKTHCDLGIKCLEHGKNILIEKPMATNVQDCIRLNEAAQQSEGILMVGHIFRFHPALRNLKDLISAGELGDISYIYTERIGIAIPREDMGVLFALAIHDVDISCYLLDVEYPDEIMGHCYSRYRDYPDEMAVVFQKFASGTIAICHESWLNPVWGKRRSLQVIGSRASAQINYLVPDTIELFGTHINMDDSQNPRVVNEGSSILRFPYQEPLEVELRHFIECSLTGRRSLADGTIGMRAVRMIEATMESIKRKQSIKFSLFLE